MDRETLARAIVGEYAGHYADYDRAAGRSADLAALRLGAFAAVTGEFGKLVAALSGEGVDHDRILLAHWYAQTYKADQFVDLLDLCHQLKRFLGEQRRVVQACDAVEKALRKCVIVSRCSGFATQHSYGVSIYFPWSSLSPDYHDHPFASATGWTSLLAAHIRKTRREPRYGGRFVFRSGSWICCSLQA